MTHICTSSFNW